MRISDWSSDVCSSDLRCAGRAVRRKFLDRLAEGGGAAFGIGGYAFRRVWIGKARKADFPADAQGLVQWQVGRKLVQPPRPAYGRAAVGVDGLRDLAIGRASCRERVCQYV